MSQGDFFNDWYFQKGETKSVGVEVGAGDPLSAAEISPAWSFQTKAVADSFDRHVRSQLPWYDTLSAFIADVAISFIPQRGHVVDVGASTGNISKLLAPALSAKSATITNLEPSAAMVENWQGYGEVRVVNAEEFDLNNRRPDLITLFLTLMFVPPNRREQFMRKIFGALQPGGAVLVVDKGFIEHPMVQVACKSAQAAEKARQGVSADSYVTKELSLRGEQRPTDDEALVDLADQFNCEAQEIFRFGEFYGLVFIKRTI